jgi:hypothetical protein
VIGSDENGLPEISGRSRSSVVRFIDYLLKLIGDLPTHWRHFAEYFFVLLQIANIGPDECDILVQRNTIARLVDFYLGEDSPINHTRLPSHKQKKTKMGDKFQNPNLTHMVSLISVCSSPVPWARPRIVFERSI